MELTIGMFGAWSEIAVAMLPNEFLKELAHLSKEADDPAERFKDLLYRGGGETEDVAKSLGLHWEGWNTAQNLFHDIEPWWEPDTVYVHVDGQAVPVDRARFKVVEGALALPPLGPDADFMLAFLGTRHKGSVNYLLHGLDKGFDVSLVELQVNDFAAYGQGKGLSAVLYDGAPLEPATGESLDLGFLDPIIFGPGGRVSLDGRP